MATSQATDSQDSRNCTLAYDVLKSKLSKLVVKIPPEEISDELLSSGIISEKEYEFSYDKRETRKERTRQLLYKVMQAVKEKYEIFETFCCALDQSENASVQKWGETLRG